LFMLRGKTKEEIIDALRVRRAGSLAVAEESSTYAPDQVEAVDARPLDETLEDYWDLGAHIDQVTLHIATPTVEMPLLKRLGAPDFVDARTLWAQMRRVYEGIAERAIEMAFADAGREQDTV
jgi:uncharacterized Zn finger protein